MTPLRRAALQEAILAHVKADGTTDAEIAAWAGVERCEVSRWRSGERRMTVDALHAIVARSGSGACLQPLADAAGALVQDQARTAVDLESGALEITEASVHLQRAVRSALGDGRVSQAEARELGALLGELDAKVRQLHAGVAR